MLVLRCQDIFDLENSGFEDARSYFREMSKFNFRIALSLLVGFFVHTSVVVAQDASQLGVQATESDRFASFRVAPTSVLSEAVTPLIEIARKVGSRDLKGDVVKDMLDFNLGMEVTPIKDLNFQAGAWQQETSERPGNSAQLTSNKALSQLYIESSTANEFDIDESLIGPNVQSRGFDIGASYAWDTSRFGQFTLSAKTTYVEEFQHNASILDLFNDELGNQTDRVVSPELQSSLMLTWEFGNHTAKAITKYFDSFKDLNELDIDEIHALVDNIATVDFQYGYSVETGNNDRAIISFGIRNIFNERTAIILNSTARILDQNGRVAYGSIKYQF